jgi:hypothetical protein
MGMVTHIKEVDVGAAERAVGKEKLVIVGRGFGMSASGIKKRIKMGTWTRSDS